MHTYQKIITASVALVALLTACRKDRVIITPNPSGPSPKSLDVAAMWKDKAPKAQKFTIDMSKNETITTSSGSRFYFSSNCLLHTDGSPVTGTVEVNITEFRTAADMLFSGVTVTSGSELLESGGMFDIHALQNGEELRADKTNGYILAEIPTSSKNIVAMDLWQGQMNDRDNRNKIDWKQIDSARVNPVNRDSMQGNKSFQYVLNFNYFKFGYCNIDREPFSGLPRCKKFRIKMPKGCADSNSTALLLFKKFNSCAWCHWLTDEDAISTYYSLPVGETIKVLVYKKTGKGEDDLEYAIKEYTLEDDALVEFTTLTKCTMSDLEGFIKAL